MRKWDYGLFLELVKRSGGGNTFTLVDVLSDNFSPRQRAEQAKQLMEDGLIELEQLVANDTSITIKGIFTEKGLAQIKADYIM
jgi:diaminopimelate epimerase